MTAFHRASCLCIAGLLLVITPAQGAIHAFARADELDINDPSQFRPDVEANYNVVGGSTAVATFTSRSSPARALATALISERNTLELKAFSSYDGALETYAMARWKDTFVPRDPATSVFFRFRVDASFGAAEAVRPGRAITGYSGGGVANLELGGLVVGADIDFGVNAGGTYLNSTSWHEIVSEHVGARRADFVGVDQSGRGFRGPGGGPFEFDVYLSVRTYYGSRFTPGAGFADASHTVTLLNVVDENGASVSGPFGSGIVPESQADAVPEPSSFVIFGCGIFGLLAAARRKQNKVESPARRLLAGD